MIRRPPPIRTDASNAFAHHTMVVRVPQILADAIATQPAQWTADALARLRDEIVDDAPIRDLAAPAPDLDAWASETAQRAGERWLSTDWFFAETYAYRRAIEAVRFWETAVDPFRATKEEELAREATWARVESALALRARPSAERVHALLLEALWGNRMDLSYAAAAAHGTVAGADDLLVDDRASALRLLAGARAPVHLVADNAGTELLVDLALVDALLEAGAARVVVHVKAHPMFVSDAIAGDVRDAIARFKQKGGDVRALGDRLDAAFVAARLAIAPDTYWNSPRFIDERPPRIERALSEAGAAIVKGDANYRRLVGDALWDPTTPPRDASGPLPCPMLALRTLKSDTIVGLPSGLSARVDAMDGEWRVNGKRGVAQWFPID